MLNNIGFSPVVLIGHLWGARLCFILAAVNSRMVKKVILIGSAPFLAIHGNQNPHPAEGVEKPLSKTLKNFRFVLLRNCGCKPWIEKYAREDTFSTLRKELDQ